MPYETLKGERQRHTCALTYMLFTKVIAQMREYTINNPYDQVRVNESFLSGVKIHPSTLTSSLRPSASLKQHNTTTPLPPINVNSCLAPTVFL